MKRDSISGLSSAQLVQLLGVGAEEGVQDAGDPSEKTARLLSDRLAGPLPMKTDVVEALPVLMGKLQRKLVPQEGKSVGELLLDKETKLDAIRMIKDYGKKLGKHRGSESEHAVGVVIYYAAIASALLFQNEKITSYSFKSLAESFEIMMQKPWLPSSMSRLYAKAKKLCRKQE